MKKIKKLRSALSLTKKLFGKPKLSLKTAFLFGIRNIKGKKIDKREFRQHMLSAMLGIALSIVPVIVVLVVSSGMIEGITGRFIEFETAHLRIKIFSEKDNQELSSIKDKVLEIPEVKYAFIERTGLALLYLGPKKFVVTVRAVPEELYKEDQGFYSYFSLVSGEFDLSSKNSILLGKAMALELGVAVGDTVKLLTHEGDLSNHIVARPNRLKVVGIYSIGYQELDKNTVFISFESGKSMLAFDNSSEYLKIKVDDPYADLTPVIKEISDKLIDAIGIGSAVTWFSLKRSYYTAYQTTKYLLILIMMLIVLVASFNISSSMVMVVMDRVQEIGILSSIGASPRTIMLAFVIVGFFTGFLGTIIGIMMGLLIAVNINEVIKGIEIVLNFSMDILYTLVSPFIGAQQTEAIKILNPEYYLEVIPIRIAYNEIIFIAFVSIFLSIVFTYLPARMAGRIKPLEVIRKY